jgi:hypothetical protein
MNKWVIVLLFLVVLVGCGDNELGLQHRRPNSPPETTLSSGPPDSSLTEPFGTVYQVHLFWSGSDRDGTVDHYDFIMIDHPRIASHIDSIAPDDPTQVVVQVPAPDDPRWTGTTATDSTFITLADTLRRDAQPGPGQTADEVRNAFLERWHTFFVRAVDNEGAIDQTPDYRSFNSHNIAPQIWFTAPILANTEFNGPPVIVFNWDGRDPIGDGTSIDPVASRYVIITSPIDIDEVEKYTNFPDSLYHLPEGREWSPWRSWDAQDGSGRRAIIRGLAKQNEFPGSGFYLFAVQALDEAGGVTPVFDHSSPSKNNVARVKVSGAVGPILTVREEFLGTNGFQGDARPIELDIAAGQALNFQFSADASRYGGEIVAYRYGWNVINPNDERQWDQNWSGSVRRATPRSFASGTPSFIVQTRDIADQVTSAEFKLTVHTVNRARDLLWVDDSDHQQDLVSEGREDARWEGVFEDLAAQWGFSFEKSQDVFDVRENRQEEPPIQMVFSYKTVVWTTRSGATGTSALRNLALFFDPIPDRNLNATKSFNFLNIYLANKGSMWASGFRPAKLVWPVERDVDRPGAPVNVTNWNDPIQPHDLIDSVGTTSFLFKMGIELFDVGSALDSPRRSLPHFCQGFVRSDPAPLALESSLELSHAHFLHVPGEVGDASLAQIQDFATQTDTVQGHSHAATITRDELLKVRNGFPVTVEGDPQFVAPEDPEPHTHTFDVVDLSGRWGAPPIFTASDWPQPPSPMGRTNIEIYNMPFGMLLENPSLSPRRGISTTPYLYVSGVREDLGQNVFFPDTADRQPAVVLAKGSPAQAYYTRAFCGFEPYLLAEESHRDLTEFIIVRHFRLGYFDR